LDGKVKLGGRRWHGHLTTVAVQAAQIRARKFVAELSLNPEDFTLNTEH
jgi:hypothetical protein